VWHHLKALPHPAFDSLQSGCGGMFKKKWHVSTSFWCQEGEGYLAPQLIIGFGEHLQVGVLRQKLEWLRFVPKSLATGKSSSVSFLDGKMKSF